jgi:hypothetical protein
MLVVNQLVGFGVGGGPYVANAVTFDGSNDNLTKSTALLGASESKKYTCNFWILLRDNSNEQKIFRVDTGSEFGDRIELELRGNSTFTINVANNGSFVTQMKTSPLNTGQWYQITFSLDASDTNKRHLQVDGVSDINVIKYNNDTWPSSKSNVMVGFTEPTNSEYLDADLADFSFFEDVYTDLSVDNPFRSANGKPTDPGNDGSSYGLGTPIIMLTGPTADWHTNKGSGGGFTENGALATASTSPSD